jgi:hypothetical protein
VYEGYMIYKTPMLTLHGVLSAGNRKGPKFWQT